jgi:hypothetical protein
MKTKLILLTGCLFLVLGLVNANSGFAFVSTIHAEGQDLGGVKEANVDIGISTVAETSSAPPYPPQYSTVMELYSPSWEPLLRDIRQEGEPSYMWTLGIDPHGNMGEPIPRSSTMSWNTGDFSGKGCELREGFDGTGNVVVSDMSGTSSYVVTGGQGVQFFNIICQPDFCVPNGPEICDGVDNDCNGTVDDNLTDTGGACSAGTGACRADGTEECNGGVLECNAVAGTGTDEICDGVDNDCDGTADENLTRATTCGVGECSGNTGTETCTAGVWGNDTCDPLAGATAEVCDNLDNDCDGEVDECVCVPTGPEICTVVSENPADTTPHENSSVRADRSHHVCQWRLR